MKHDESVQEGPPEVAPVEPTEKRVRILILEDAQFDAELIVQQLRGGGVPAESKCVTSKADFLLALTDFRPDLVLSDYNLPNITALEALAYTKEKRTDVPFVLVTGAIGEEAAIEIMRNGATDYILKDKLVRLAPVVKRALKEARDAARRRESDELLRLQHIRLKGQNEKLFESEQRFRQLAENIQEVFWMTDVQKSQMIYVSPGYEAVWGRPCQGLYNSPKEWMDAIHPEDREAVSKALTKQASGAYDEVYRITRPDGSIRWIHDRAFPVGDVSGEVYRIAGIAEDITDRKLAEQRLETRNAVIRLFAETDTLGEAIPKILQTICEHLSWEFGALWKQQADVVRCVHIWCASKSHLGEFEKSTHERSFQCGEGFPSRIWEAVRPVWIPDLTAESTLALPRAPIAARCGLRSAVGFPVLLNNQVIGVMEFFSHAIREPDKALLEMMSVLGGWIGQFIARKEAEAALRQAETKFRSIYENSMEGIFQTTPDGHCLGANQAFANIAGYSSPQELIKSISDLSEMYVDPKSRLVFREKLERFGFVRNFENRIYRKNGRKIWLNVNARAVKDDKGETLYYEGTVQDITGRKEAERRATTLAHAVESTAEMICITDLDDHFTFVNGAFEKTYGYSAAEILGKSPEMLFSPNNPPALLTEILMRTRSGGWRGEVLDRRKDGTEFPVFLSTSIIRDSAGQPIGLMGVAQDISERQRSEHQIRLLAHSVQSTAEIVSITDSANRITFVNKAFLDACGYEEQEVLGRTPEFLYSPGNEPGLCDRIYRHSLEGGWTGELLNRTRDGREFPISLTTSPIKNAAGIVVGLVGLAKDISERKRTEKQTVAFSVLGHRLSSANTREEAGEIIMDVASELYGWDAGYMHLYSKWDDRIIPVLTVDMVDGQRMPIPPETFTQDPSPLMKLVMKDGAQLINQENSSDLPADVVRFGDRSRPSASKMYVPVRSAGDVLGVLSIQSYTPRAYSAGDLMLLQTLADHCGGALARIAASEALRTAEAKYRSIFENATEGIFQTTFEGRYISANPALACMFGYSSPAELISTVQNIEHQTFVSAETANVLKQKLATSDYIVDFEAERYRKDRTKFWTSINVRVLRDSAGAVLYYEGTVQDITKRKLTESILRDSERKLRLIAENTDDVIFSFDMQREPVYANPAVEKLTGYTFSELQQRKFINWIHPDDQERMLQLWEDLYQGKGYSEVEFRLISKQGETKWCSSAWGPLFDEDGRQIGVQGFERDITERKYLERELVESTNNERRRVGHELHDGLGQYLAAVAIRAKALEQALLADNVRHAPEAKELAALVSNAINQTRSIARGLDPIDVETIGLPAALQNLITETEKFVNIKCSLKCSDLPAPLSSDAALAIYRIVQESIHNAMTHGDAGSVNVVLSGNSDGLTVCVKDDGSGFDPSTAKQTGMGLRVMQYRARSLGGQVKISSEPGRGATVCCTLPFQSMS
jgi:PAS domain S-box-containing protein